MHSVIVTCVAIYSLVKKENYATMHYSMMSLALLIWNLNFIWILIILFQTANFDKKIVKIILLLNI